VGSTKFACAAVAVLAISLPPAGSAIGSAPSTGSATARIAFVNGRTFELWVTSLDGRVQRPLTRSSGPVSGFAWSPDGRRLVFVGAGALHVVNRDGSGLRTLASPFTAGPTWSHDGRRVAYGGFEDGRPQIFVASVAGGTAKNLAPSVRAAVSPAWSPRGTTIAFATANADAGQIYRVEADGRGLRTLTQGADDSHPTWSPDGRMLLFQRYTCPTASSCGYELNVMRADGTMHRRLVHVPFLGGGARIAAWSPDGRRIAFWRLKGLGSEVIVMDADGKHARSLSRGQRSASDPAWSPDGRRIVYESGASIFVMNADGSAKRRLVDAGRIPAWQPRP
jgi:TolB protein